MKKHLFFLFCVWLSFVGGPVLAMSSVNYQINWDTVNEGGSEAGTSTNYQIQDTIGQPVAGTSTSVNYQLLAGYRVPQEAVNALFFTVRAQSARTAYTNFNAAGKTVTVNSAAGFFTGSYIAVVENFGLSQKVAVGRISSIAGSVINVDNFEGATGVMNTVSVNGDDFVYLLGGSAVPFGTVYPNTPSTAVVMTAVRSSAPNGYVVSVQANQNLQNQTPRVMAFGSGTIQAGQEGYGASVTGTRAYLPDTDLGVSSTVRVIAQSAVPSGLSEERVAMTFKLSTTANTPVGNYTQSLYYTLTANY